MQPVRAILFDKTPSANWKVVWHQDLTIAVRERGVVSGFGPWSEKEGVVHVQPPIELLERMLAVRVHLDDCGADNGPVRVLPASHRVGRLSGEAIDEWRKLRAPVNLHDETRRLTLRVLFDAALSGGEDFPSVEEASRHIDSFISRLGRFTLSDFLPMPNSWRPSTERLRTVTGACMSWTTRTKTPGPSAADGA